MKRGTTRLVFLIGGYAIKVPRPNRWKSFLRGILANMDERLWYKNSPESWRLKMCPSLSCFLGGFVLISKRAYPIDLEDYQEIDFSFYNPLPLDRKILNFGWYENRIVLVDYADSKYFCSDCEKIFKIIQPRRSSNRE